MNRLAAACIGLWLGAAAAAAGAADFGSIGKPAAILYDGPSLNAEKKFIAPQGMPVELLSLINRWVKVRDQTGQSFWIERGDLSPKRMLVAVRVAPVHSAARDDASVVFQVAEGVLLELVESAPVSGWVRVRHADGSTGYVRAADVWGL